MIKTRGIGSKAGGGPGSIEHAKITAIFPETNSITVEFADSEGPRTIQLESPFASMNSGRRAVPEVGSWVVLSFRETDTDNPTIIKYRSSDEYDMVLSGGQVPNAENTKSQYSDPRKATKGSIPYRLLQPGELEDFSAGGARSFASARGRWEFWAGNVMLCLDRDDLDAGLYTPEFFIHGADADAKGLEDSLRFGVISRILGGDRVKTHLEYQGEFPKEFRYDLRWLGTPKVLVVHQEGICLDENGSEVKDSVTGKLLRRQKQYYTLSSTKTTEHVDEAGNIRTVVATDATHGIITEATGGNSSWVQKIGRNVERTVGVDSKETIGSNESSSVGANHLKTIGSNSTTSVGGNTEHSSGGNHRLTASVIYLN